jgi:hypothetical protein
MATNQIRSRERRPLSCGGAAFHGKVAPIAARRDGLPASNSTARHHRWQAAIAKPTSWGGWLRQSLVLAESV